jgi:hypothetical protein
MPWRAEPAKASTPSFQIILKNVLPNEVRNLNKKIDTFDN